MTCLLERTCRERHFVEERLLVHQRIQARFLYCISQYKRLKYHAEVTPGFTFISRSASKEPNPFPDTVHGWRECNNHAYNTDNGLKWKSR